MMLAGGRSPDGNRYVGEDGRHQPAASRRLRGAEAEA